MPVPQPDKADLPPAATAVRIGYGAILLVCPSLLTRRLAGVSPDRRARRVMRVLGARHLAQGALTALYPSPRTTALGAGVDALHATSMVLLARADPQRRRLASIDAGIEGAFAALGASRAFTV